MVMGRETGALRAMRGLDDPPSLVSPFLVWCEITAVSLSVIVPVATPSPMPTPAVAVVMVTVKVSSPSTMVSLTIGTARVASVSPSSIVTVVGRSLPRSASAAEPAA